MFCILFAKARKEKQRPLPGDEFGERRKEQKKIFDPEKITMRAHHLSLFFILLSLSTSITKSSSSSPVIHRRILHQPLFPAGSAPPPGTDNSLSSPPPPPDSPVFPDPSQPFFPEVPSGQTPDQNQQTTPPAAPTNGSIPIPTATQPAKPAKKVAIAISVGIVTLGMLSGLAFFLYRHRAKHPGETQKLVGGNSERFQEDSRVPPSSFLYIGTVEPSTRSASEVNEGANGSPYHKLNSVKRSDRYGPSPELQPLPPLAKPPTLENSPTAMSSSSSSSDEESQATAFCTGTGLNTLEKRRSLLEGTQKGSKKTPGYHPRVFFTLEPWSLVEDR